ncbi:hypothetical protein LguiA_008191 [Lonicera macranthoides]
MFAMPSWKAPLNMVRFSMYVSCSMKCLRGWLRIGIRQFLGIGNWGNEVEAHRLFDLMPEKNAIMWTAMVTGYSKVKDLESARRCFNQMPDKRVALWNAVSSGYAQNGFAEEDVELFNDMMNASVQTNETTWVTVILSCSSRGDPCFAESLVKMLDNMAYR